MRGTGLGTRYRPARKLDGVTLAVITNRFEGVVRHMMNTLFRTGRSTVLSTGRDFSCCIVTGSDEFLVAGESLPVHVLAGPDKMARVMRDYHPTLRRGDAFLHNSPYLGNSHAADHTILVPVVDDDGRHHFTVVAKAHQADCGNATPTTYAATARDVYEEGALIFPCVRVQEDYADIGDIIRMCETRIRVPEQWRGDYLALIGAARTGERRLLELEEEFGWDLLREYTEAWFDYSEERMIEAIGMLPPGIVVAEGIHDPFPGVPEGIPVRAIVDVRPDEGIIEVDLRDNPDCQPCGLNLTEATARTAAMIGVFNSIDHTVPKNSGSFRRIIVKLRENCVAGIPRHPASCSLGTTNVCDRLVNAVQRGIADLGDGFGMAEVGLPIPPSVAVISGSDPRRDGEHFVNELILPSLTGGAGSPNADGWLTAGLAVAAGMMRRDSVEIDELRYPIRVVDQRIIPDSEGAGRFRGAPGALAEYGPVECEIAVMYASDGTINPAQGAREGLAGSTTSQFMRDAPGELTPLPACGRVELRHGERIVSMSCGGGGYGPPSERDPELVAHDVREGWVSTQRAQEVYRVGLSERGEVDEEKTRKLRSGQGAGQ